MSAQPKPNFSWRSEPVEHPNSRQEAPRQTYPTPEYELSHLLSRPHASAAEDIKPTPDRGGSWSVPWFLEVVAILFSVACMVGVIYILMYMKDQPLSKWPYDLNLNSTIAVLITALKSSLMLAVASCISQSKWLYFKKRRARVQQFDKFDEASRGPLGAVKLLWSFRSPFHLAWVGAVITIVILGVDTFAQQVIKFDSRTDPVDNNGTALFMITDTYDGGARVQDQSFTPTQAKASTVDTSMQGAIYRGLYNTASSQPFNCSSQCVWPNIARSLAIASQCEDVTTRALDTLTHTTFSNGTHHQRVVTPGNITLIYANGPTSWNPVIVVSAKDLTPKRFNEGVAYTPEFVRVGILRMRDSIKEERDYWYLGSNVTEIFECTVRFTAYEYSDIRTEGSELAIGKTKETALGLGYKYDMNTTKHTWHAVFNQTQGTSFSIATPDMGALADFFTTDRFSGSIFDGETPPPSSGMGAAFLKGNIPAVFDNMARSMTDHLRSGYGNVQPIKGKTLVAVTIVHVYWVWLSLPLGVLILAILLFVATVWGSWDSRGQLWKSSVVAALYHHIAPGTDSGAVLFTDVRSTKQLEKLAEETSLIYRQGQ
ncbi:hypothetical protein PG996_005004 [Apiospora saccharicola]|uniref:Uncharacterized protein n=1 Tax=Apiospora saccharicola TaxID=335842 RepID=A0ABR1VK90_9PEZI